MSSKKWILTTFSITIILMLLLSLTTYIVDPLHQYRYSPEQQYPLSPRYSISGLIKNYEYDSVLLGSSMTQNFDADDFKNELNLDILKVTMGGMNFPDIKFNMQLINEVGKCEKMFVCIDVHKFAEKNPETNMLTYLYNGYADDFKYLLSSDVYTRFLPLSLVSNLFKAMDKPIPSMIMSKSEPNKMGYWADRYEFGEDVLLNDVENNKNGVSDVELEGMDSRLRNNIDELFNYIDEETEYVFFFPPYSAFYWEYCDYKGYMNGFLDAKVYFCEQAEKYDNIKIYDFQNSDETINFDNYKDTTHYSGKINRYMVECFAKAEYLVKNSADIIENNEGIAEKVSYVKENYSDTLTKSDR